MRHINRDGPPAYLHELDMRHEKPESFSFDGVFLAAKRAIRDGQPA